MKDLVKTSVKRITDSRRWVYERYKAHFQEAGVSYEDFLEHIETGESSWEDKYKRSGLGNIIDYTIDWSESDHDFYSNLNEMINEAIEEGDIDERPV